MRVGYKIFVEMETDDYVETLGEINDLLQDNLSGDPEITNITIVKYHRLRE